MPLISQWLSGVCVAMVRATLPKDASLGTVTVSVRLPLPSTVQPATAAPAFVLTAALVKYFVVEVKVRRKPPLLATVTSVKSLLTVHWREPRSRTVIGTSLLPMS